MFGNSGALGAVEGSLDMGYGSSAASIGIGRFINSRLFNPSPVQSPHDVE